MKYLTLFLVALSTVHANSFIGMWIGKEKPMAIEFRENQEVYFGEMKVSTYSINENDRLVFEVSGHECFAEMVEGNLVFYSFGREPDTLIRANEKKEFLQAFEALRWESKQKTIANNLRQILLVGQQYLSENSLSKVSYSELKEMNLIDERVAPQAGESYSNLIVTSNTESLEVLTEDGKSVTYPFTEK